MGIEEEGIEVEEEGTEAADTSVVEDKELVLDLAWQLCSTQ